MELLDYLRQDCSFQTRHEADVFAREWKPVLIRKGEQFAQQDYRDTDEYIVLNGQVASQIFDPEGRAVCVGMYAGPSVVTPNVARSNGGVSRVTLEATSESLIMRMSSERLMDLMLTSKPIREWANAVLQRELERKADREWCLAALGGAERLIWFRKTYPEFEDLFNHGLIATFLGMTPVTLSRLRNDRN